MKKLLAVSCIVFAFACNSGTSDTTETDSTTVIDPNAVTNDVPMRTVDTNQNVMRDTSNGGDSLNRP